MTGLKPDDVRQHIPGFDKKRYTNPSMMAAALKSLGVEFLSRPTNGKDFCQYGICRIQWLGPWTEPGVPPAAAYHYTHWVGCLQTGGKPTTWIYDLNMHLIQRPNLDNADIWPTLAQWAGYIVPKLTKYSGATGGWLVTHNWELTNLPMPAIGQ
jgi:hypothetical protein